MSQEPGLSFDLDPRSAAGIYLDRKACRNSLTSWVRKAGFEPAEHHRLIIEKLEAVARGDIRRLALFLPPGSAKSTYASVLYPPWYLSRHPDAALIVASHTQELAERWGRRCRSLIEHYGRVLGIGLSGEVRAASRWETEGSLGEIGEYYAAGLGGSITGRRADLVIIDDPVRNREDADSEIIRDKAHEWWLFDLLPRLKPDARIVLIQTRWHEDDLAGRILSTEQGWEVIRLPMEAEPDDPLGRAVGERLWPTWFTASMVEQAKRDSRVWSALYQQSPTLDTGDYFRREWLHTVDHLPARNSVNIYGASDLAVTSRGGDYSVHLVVGVDAEGQMTVLDLWRGQTSSDEWIETWCDMVEDWRPLEWAEETGQINAAVGPFMLRRQRERHAYVHRRQFPVRHDKAVRAQSIRARMATLGLYLPRKAPWRADLEAELLRFPAGKHDDQVDALGLIGQLLDRVRPADSQKLPEPEHHPSGYTPIVERGEKRRLSVIEM